MTPLDDVLARLTARDRKPKQRGNTWHALCPAHDDGRNPSLTVKEGDDGRVLLHCHGASCPVPDICAALDMTEADLYPRDTRPTSDARIEAMYDYTDEAGELLYQNVRYVPKDFRWRRPVSPSKGAVSDWIWTLDDVRRVPYRLPSVLAAAQAGRAVLFVEGEKDADALEALGFAATSSKNWLAEFAEYVKGVAVAVVIADCDQARPGKNEKRGRETAQAVAASLAEAGVKVKVLDLAPGRDDGYDVSDFILEYGDEARMRLERLAINTPYWTGKTLAQPPIVTAAEFKKSVGPYDETREYLGGFFYGGTRVHIIGQVNHGKTTFTMEALSAALHGREFLGWQGAGGSTRGVYVDLEQPDWALDRGLTDAGLYDEELKGRFSLWHEPNGLEIDRNEQHREMIESLCAEFQIVVIDPWYKLIADELSDGMRNVRPVVSFLDSLRNRYKRTAVICGRHTNEVERGKLLDLRDASGYKAYERAADATVGFQRIRGDRSRLIWMKTRHRKLPKLGEVWTVDWAPGAGGFVRIEPQRAIDRLHESMVAEWETLGEICDRYGGSRSAVSELLARLVRNGRAEVRGEATGGRGKLREWKQIPDAQERLAA